MAVLLSSIQLCDAFRVPVLTAAETAALLPVFEVTERLGEPDQRVTETLPLHPNAGYLRARATLRLDFAESGVFSRREWWRLWRVAEPEGEAAQTGVIVCEWRPYWLILDEAVAAPRTGAGALSDDLAFALTDRTPASALGVLFDPENGAPVLPDGDPLFAVGDVHALFSERSAEIDAEAATALGVLTGVCESLGCEWRARVVVDTDPTGSDPYTDTYAVDLLIPPGERGLFEPGIEADELVLDLTLLAKDALSATGDAPRYGPGVSLVRGEEGQEAVSAVFPLSEAVDVGQAGVAGALWYPGPSTFYLKVEETIVEIHRSRIGEYPAPALVVWEADALNGYAVQETGGLARTFPIADSAYPNVLTLTGDAETVPLFREVRILTPEDHHGTGTGRVPVRVLASPLLRAAYGPGERPIRFSAHPLPNLLDRAGVSSDFSRWTGGLPYGVDEEGDVTVTETTDAADVRHGARSAEVAFASSAGVALTGDDLEVYAESEGTATDTDTESALYADGGGSLEGRTYRATASAEVTRAYRSSTATATATLRMRFLDVSDALIGSAVTDSISGNASRLLVCEGTAPAACVKVEVEVEADTAAAIGGTIPPASAFATAAVTGATLEEGTLVTSGVMVGAGSVPETGALWMNLRVSEGAVEVRIEDESGAVVSNEEGTLTLTVAADGSDSANTPFTTVTFAWSGVPDAAQIAVRPTSGAATVILDAAALVPGVVPVPYRAAMGPEALWELAARELSRRVADGVAASLSTFDGEYLDLAAAGVAPGTAVGVGQAVRVRGAFTSYTGGVYSRVTEVQYRDGVGANAVDRRIAVGSLGPDLSDVIEAVARGTVSVTTSTGGLLDVGGQFVATDYTAPEGATLGAATLEAYGAATITTLPSETFSLRAAAGGGSVTIAKRRLGSPGVVASSAKLSKNQTVATLKVVDQT